ncbi:hypothetical protein ACFPL7_18850 [Dongia soli]|uniref:DUF1328 domain-containing protein n=2 Tax=Dongia soli TaxID=600628 RepID=A0ABU5E653_9PROT|nr:hypothetical protein [Dongia soli]
MTLLIGIFGVAGLFVAANAGHGVPYWGGLLFFLFAILLMFWQIAKGDEHVAH